MCPRVTSRATVFDPAVTIDGTVFNDIGDITIEEAVRGAGISGVIESKMTITLFAENFYAPDNAEVLLHIPGFLPPKSRFFITRREKIGNKIKLICGSLISLLDRPSDFTDDDFDENGIIATSDVLNHIAALCGFFAVTYQSISVLETLPTVGKAAVKGKNCLTLLENIAKALCCTFREYGGNLSLCPFEQVFIEYGEVTPIAPVKSGFRKTVGKVILTNKSESFSAGAGTLSQTLKIETPFASAELANRLYSRLAGREYIPFEAYVKLDFLTAATALFTLGGSDCYVNNIKMHIKKTGVYAKIVCNGINEDEWDENGEMARRLSEKIGTGERFGAMTLMAEGAITLSNADHSAVMNCNDENEPSISGDVLNLQALDEIKLNPETLLTESKDLVGALNELFTAAPEGGDFSGLSDLFAHIPGALELFKTNGVVFGPGGCGVYYDTPTPIPSLQFHYVDTETPASISLMMYVKAGNTVNDEVNIINNVYPTLYPTSASGEFTLTFDVPENYKYYRFMINNIMTNTQHIKGYFTVNNPGDYKLGAAWLPAWGNDTWRPQNYNYGLDPDKTIVVTERMAVITQNPDGTISYTKGINIPLAVLDAAFSAKGG